ncbi:MAG: hypothetical protein ACI4VQ_02685 [Clostridia bacterium]
MREKYYYFVKIDELRKIAEEGLKPSEWNQEDEINTINFYVGEEGVLEYIQEASNQVNQKFNGYKISTEQYIINNVCLSLNLDGIEAQIRYNKGICTKEITPDKISVVTVKNLVNDKISNTCKDFANKIRAEKEKMITPYLAEEIELDEFIKENPNLQISQFENNTSLVEKSDNIIIRFFRKIKTFIFKRKNTVIENI